MRPRYEFKYMIDDCQKSILILRTSVLLSGDPHSNSDGYYNIRSLYFDDFSDSCLTDNLAGVDPREKYRIRYYNDDSSLLFLEKKSKVKGMTIKSTVQISETEYMELVKGEYQSIINNSDAKKSELVWEMEKRELIPKVIVSYRRTPFVNSMGNVRVTFDNLITSSYETNRFLTGDYVELPVLKSGKTILEVKWDELLPDHIFSALNIEGLQWTAFSKYSICRMVGEMRNSYD